MSGRALSLLALILLVGATLASAETRSERRAGLSVAAHMRVVGLGEGSDAAVSVDGAGDVNGDGLPDVIVGTPRADWSGRADSGSAYVLFGSRSPRTVDVRRLGTAGFRIDGGDHLLPVDEEADAYGALGDNAGSDVAGAGDVNGDGLADVAIGAALSGASLRLDAGSVYVVFGKRTTERVDLGALGSGGYRIDGDRVGDEIGSELSDAGDVNGDGRPDLVISSTRSGAYVVFGKSDVATVDLRSLGFRGIRIRNSEQREPRGFAVGAAGDVNGDRLGDLLLGDHHASPRRRRAAGSAWVVLGRRTPGEIDLRALHGGYRIDGAVPGELIGLPVAGAGDVNGDGRPDALVGGNAEAELEGEVRPGGVAYVVFGGTGGPVDLRRLGARGFRIDAERAGDALGSALAPAGDLNGDGRADLALGAFRADGPCRSDAGSVYIVLGRPRRGPVTLRRSGYRFLGARRGAGAGAALAPVGDLTGDARPELVVGSAGTEFDDRRRTYAEVFSPVLRPRARAPRRPPACLRIRIRRTSLTGLLQTGRLVVRLTALEAKPLFSELEVSVLLRRRGRRPREIARKFVDLRRPGRRTLSLRLSRRARRTLSARRRVRLRVVAYQEGSGNQPPHRAAKTIVLSR